MPRDLDNPLLPVERSSQPRLRTDDLSFFASITFRSFICVHLWPKTLPGIRSFSRATSKMTPRIATPSRRHAEPLPFPRRSSHSVVKALPRESPGDHLGDCDDRAVPDPDARPLTKPAPRHQNQTSEANRDENVIIAKSQDPVRVAANSAVPPTLDERASKPDEPKATPVWHPDPLKPLLGIEPRPPSPPQSR